MQNQKEILRFHVTQEEHTLIEQNTAIFDTANMAAYVSLKYKTKPHNMAHTQVVKQSNSLRKVGLISVSHTVSVH